MHLLITAGGTREYIDPVRFISNASSGKMGYALARAAHVSGVRLWDKSVVDRYEEDGQPGSASASIPSPETRNLKPEPPGHRADTP